jgi:enamine deaminase RidA (YjgF/YER057c/UK114 family)
MMALKRYCTKEGTAGHGEAVPIARAVEANGWLYASGQVPMLDGQLVTGNITVQARQAILNLIAVLTEAGYTPEHVVRCGVWLEDSRDFGAFNAVFREYFGAQCCSLSVGQSHPFRKIREMDGAPTLS